MLAGGLLLIGVPGIWRTWSVPVTSARGASGRLARVRSGVANEKPLPTLMVVRLATNELQLLVVGVLAVVVVVCALAATVGSLCGRVAELMVAVALARFHAATSLPRGSPV